jgi:serine/threonine protein kinase
MGNDADAGVLSPFARTINDAPKGAVVVPPAALTVGGDESVTRYRVTRTIGEGGMGRVVEAIDERFGRRVAIKELLPDGRTEEWEARFRLEAVVTANLEHPGVPGVHDRGWRVDGTPFYVMRLVQGRTLIDAIGSATTMRERLALLPAVVSAAQTLAFAHEHGVIHRDVKPQNIILGKHGQTILLDWGIAKVRGVDDVSVERPLPGISGASASKDMKDIHDSTKTRAGAVFGTPGYMAPEQARGSIDEIDERTDVFALGALLYHVLAGRAPYASESLTDALAMAREAKHRAVEAAAPDAPVALQRIVSRAMAPLRGDRFASAAELASALESSTTEALTGTESRAVERVALLVSAAALGVTALFLIVIFSALSFHEMGSAVYLVTGVAAVGCALSVLELRTSGRHALSKLSLALAASTLLASISTMTMGITRGLQALHSNKVDPSKTGSFVTELLSEALPNLGWGTILCSLQLLMWAIANRSIQRAQRKV